MKKHSILLAFVLPCTAPAQSFLDPTFGVGGYATLDVDGSFDQFKDIAVQPDGKIVAVGHASQDFVTNPFIARFTSDGDIDLGFNGTGWSLGPDPSWDTPGDYEAVAVQPDGRIVSVGAARPTSTDLPQILVTRHMPDGSFDPSFGNGGFVLYGSPSGNASWTASDLALTADGRIRICGTTNEDPDNDYEYLLLGLLADGALDASFGTGGVVNFHPGDPDHHCRAHALALQSDGRIVVATEGQVDMVGYVTIIGLRLNVDGSLDTSFGEGGLIINYNDVSAAWSLAIGPDDEVLLSCFGSIIGSYQDLVTLQLDADGQNVVESVYECCDDESLMPQGAWVQEDGKAVAFGMTDGDGYILRRLPDGTLDPTFGNGGVLSETTVEIDYAGDGNTGGFWQEGNGRMLVCGRSGVVPGNGDDAIVMAFLPGPVGIDGVDSGLGVRIAPNPASDRLFIDITGPLAGQSAVAELVDVTGSTVHTQVIPTLGTNTIALPSLPEGMYLLRIRTDMDATLTARVVIQH